jgi:HSP20 family molecular chaperone IbpA
MKEGLSRVSIPGRVLDLLWKDDEFFRDIVSHKKASSAGKFPRCDQWCDDDGFHMAFALAGYSPEDVSISVKGGELFLSGVGSKVSLSDDHSPNGDEDEYPAKVPKIGVQQGIIVRGIARRNFKTKYFINSSFDLRKAKASMKNGLLEILMPKKEVEDLKTIDIKE